MSRRHPGRHFRIPVIRRRHPPGAGPGTLAIDEEAPRSEISVFAYGPEGVHEAQGVEPGKLGEHLGRWPVVWVNVEGLGVAETIREVGALFDVHPLALEDVVHVHQRAKVEPYEGHLFIVARMVHSTEALSSEQVSLFVGRDFVVTFQERPGDPFDLVRNRIRTTGGRIRSAGAGYLAYALLDALVDAYFPVLERYGDRIETLEQEIMDRPGRDIVARVHAVKHDLLMLRRAIWPLREAVGGLLRDESPFIGAETRPYLRDCHDHTFQLIDLVDTYRELTSGLLDVHLSFVSHRLNEIMKVLTIFAAVFIPLTLIAGIYGMNFEHMPELKWPWGYPLAIAGMVGVAAVLLAFFRRRGWLGDGR